MRKRNLCCLFLVLLFAICFDKMAAQSIIVDTLMIDKISIRAILVSADTVWYAADKDRFGTIDLKTKSKREQKLSGNKDTEFRSIAETSSSIFVLTIGNPALLYQISKKSGPIKLVYQENHEKVFYDSMQFWNDKEGIAIGDPTENTFSIITTHDGGNSWKKIPSSELPELEDGEAAFAASNTNIVIKGDKTWIVSGGTKARIFFSPNKGKSWEIYNTPIVQGKSMTGIFTADFYDPENGFIAGGDYEKPNQNFLNKAITVDGGKTWKLIAENSGFGYASCIQYVPKSKGRQLVCVGASGLYYSADRGVSWIKLSENKDLFTIRFLDEKTAIAAGNNKILKLQFNFLN